MSESRGAPHDRDHDPAHEELEALAASYALDALDPSETAAVEAHLATCPQCRELVDSLRESTLGLSDGLETPPPAALRDRILEAVSDESDTAPTPPTTAEEPEAPEESEGPEEHRPPRRPRRRAVLAGGFALAASALVATGLVVARPWRSQEEKDIDEVLAADDAREYTTTWRSARITAVRSPSLGSAVLKVEDLPAAPSGKDYQAWTKESEGPVSAGLVHPDDDGDSRTLLSAGSAEGAAISLEPAGGSEQPTTVLAALDYS
ncbi:anti-sigma factor [Brachybacterium halotolerans subsp. kimchii]|uniref:anti-sigma factor n=1 Tax=Brachybacterium halotolerans TaxID=2795215 RepID=UPI001E5352CF|nr:anti-sigma factor [Brachybacterium halotolerans]UEJ81729.1 anti-sigma factor [Brachybacterium halotolerans subsp. kimchii]